MLPGVSRPSMRNTLSRLVAKNYLKRVKRGRYLAVPFGQTESLPSHELAVVPLLTKGDYYISFWSALSFWGFTEQLPHNVSVAASKAQPSRSFQGTGYRFVTLTPRYHLGYSSQVIDGTQVMMADREKTILDCLLHPGLCGGLGEPAKALRDHADELDWPKMAHYLKQMSNSALERRLRYCLHHLEIENRLGLLGQQTEKYRGFRWLDPQGPKERKSYDHRYGLLINIDLAEELA